MLPAPRIVTLLPSATEIVCALGMEDKLVGRSHECDYPKGVEQLPVCSEPKFEYNGTSYDIDERVKAVLQEGLSVYRIYAEKLRELRPDLIITQSQCEVCAAGIDEVSEAAGQITGTKPQIVDLHPQSLADIMDDIRKVGQALDVVETGDLVASAIADQIGYIAGEAETLKPPRVVCIEWIEPVMAAGNWMPELVEMAGGENLLGKAGQHSGFIDWQTVVRAQPDVLIIMPCGYEMQKTRSEMETLTGKPGWQDIPAVKDNRVYITDGHQYFNRPGPRIVDSVKILAEILHPDTFPFGYAQQGWIRV